MTALLALRPCRTRRTLAAPDGRREASRPLPLGPVAELAAYAQALQARSVPAWQALIELQRRFDLLTKCGKANGAESKLPYYVTCAAFNLDPDRWDPLETWSESASDPALADGIITDAEEEAAATQRAHHLAAYLWCKPTSEVSRQLVNASEKILVAYLKNHHATTLRSELCAVPCPMPISS